MLPEALRAPIGGLFAVCAAVAALETLAVDERSAWVFRSLCATACALCAARLAASLLQ